MLPNGVYSTHRFKKRERTQNWALEEKKYLLELCKKDMNVIENKRLDADLTALKNRAWKIIHQEFSKVFGNERNCNRLKEQWRRMKACTRSEILDYTHRLARYGQVVADKKRPNPFTFEIWEFMQNAKKTCKTEALPDIDYENVQLALDADRTTVAVQTKKCEEPTVVSDDDDDELFNWQKSTQSMCEVEIKDDSSFDEKVSLSEKSHQTNHHRKRSWTIANAAPNEQIQANHDSGTSALTSTNNVAATLDTLNILKNARLWNHSTKEETQSQQNDCIFDEMKLLVEMQAKEHELRMDILRVQLETAKFNRDSAEINKILLLRNLQQESDANSKK